MYLIEHSYLCNYNFIILYAHMNILWISINSGPGTKCQRTSDQETNVFFYFSAPFTPEVKSSPRHVSS